MSLHTGAPPVHHPKLIALSLLATLCLVSAEASAIEHCAQRSETPCAVTTFHSASLYWSPSQGSADRVVEIAYRVKGASAWQRGLPLTYNPIKDDAPIRALVKGDYRGSLVQLAPDTDYEVELSLSGTSVKRQLTFTTWGERFPTTPSQTVRVTEQGLETYEVTRSGTEQAYLVIDGLRPDGTRTVIDAKKRKSYNVIIKGSYVILRNFELRGAKSDAILLQDGVHHVIIEQNDISDWGSRNTISWSVNGQQKSFTSIHGKNHQSAVRAVGKNQRVKVSQLVIQNNVIHDPSFGTNHWGQCAVDVAASKARQSGGVPDCNCSNTNSMAEAERRCEHKNGGSEYNHPNGPQVFDLTNSDGNHVVRYNTIYATSEDRYFNDIFGGSSTNTNPRGYPGADSDFYGNYLRNCYDNGFEMEGGGQNVRVWDNLVDLCYEPVANAPVWIGPLYIFRNVTQRSLRTPLNFTNGTPSAGRFIKGGYARGGLTDAQALERMRGYTYVFHNTLDNTGNKGSSGIGDGRYLRYLVAQNNLFWVRNSSQAITVAPTKTKNISYTYNLTNGRIPDAFKNAGSHNRADTSFTPSFVNRRVSRALDADYPRTAWEAPIVVDYALQPGALGQDASGLLTAAELANGEPKNLIPNFSSSYEGRAPDIGAQESDAPLLIVGPRDHLAAPVDPTPPDCLPVTEICGNGIDDDCDDQTDEGCDQAQLTYDLSYVADLEALQALGESIEISVGSTRASVYVGWNENGLQLLARVDDDDVRAVVEAGGSGKVWRDDAIEVFIDPTHDGGEQMSGEDLQVVLNANGALFSSRPVTLVATTVTRTEEGWEAYVSLPWSELDVASPAAGMRFGANLALDDRDQDDTGQEDVVVQSDWRGESADFRVPKLWGEWHLLAPEVGMTPMEEPGEEMGMEPAPATSDMSSSPDMGSMPGGSDLGLPSPPEPEPTSDEGCGACALSPSSRPVPDGASLLALLALCLGGVRRARARRA